MMPNSSKNGLAPTFGGKWRGYPCRAFVQYIHEHKDDLGFFTKLMHHLSNQLLGVVIFPNCCPGRCDGWELISREDMVQQLAREETL